MNSFLRGVILGLGSAFILSLPAHAFDWESDVLSSPYADMGSAFQDKTNLTPYVQGLSITQADSRALFRWEASAKKVHSWLVYRVNERVEVKVKSTLDDSGRHTVAIPDLAQGDMIVYQIYSRFSSRDGASITRQLTYAVDGERTLIPPEDIAAPRVQYIRASITSATIRLIVDTTEEASLNVKYGSLNQLSGAYPGNGVAKSHSVTIPASAAAPSSLLLSVVDQNGNIAFAHFFLPPVTTAGTTQTKQIPLRSKPSLSIELKATPNNVTPGTLVTLHWTIKDQRDYEIGLIECSALGGWTGEKNVGTFEGVVAPQKTTTYSIECLKDGMRAGKESVTVTVLNAPMAFSADSTFVSQGAQTTIRWKSIARDPCRASGEWGGTRPPSGSEVVTVRERATFALECVIDGKTVKKSVTISTHQGATSTPTFVTTSPAFSPSPSPVPGPPPSPPSAIGFGQPLFQKKEPVAIALVASATHVKKGGTYTLSWSSPNAKACYAFDDWHGQTKPKGTAVIRANRSKKFTLNCFADDRDSGTASVTVKIKGAKAAAKTQKKANKK